MTKKRRSKKCELWSCEECCRPTALHWPDEEKVKHWLCVSCIFRIAEENQMIRSAEHDAGEFLRAGGMMS